MDMQEISKKDTVRSADEDNAIQFHVWQMCESIPQFPTELLKSSTTHACERQRDAP